MTKENDSKNINNADNKNNESENQILTSDIAIRNILDYEEKRYKRKGFGIFFAITTALIFFYFFPKFLFYFFAKYKIENEGLFYSVVTFIAHESIFIFTNSYFMIIHKLNINFFERYKVSPDPWPWESDPEEWNILLKKTFNLLLFNHLVVLPAVFIPNLIFNVCPYRLDPVLPDYFEIIPQLIFCMICEDFSFYLSHRFLHGEKFYGKIHKIHHEYKQTVCLSSEYAHPIEYIFGNILTTNLGGLILGKRMHFITFITSLTMMVHESIDGHCGYEFSWSPHRLIPMSIGAEFHIFHHLKFKGNYASLFTIWDRVGNTINKSYLEYYNLKDKKKES